MEPPPTLIGAAEAARILGVNRGTISRLAAAGEIQTAVELPGRTGARLFEIAEIERYQARRRATAGAA